MSDYHIATTDTPDDLANVLSHALGEKGKSVWGFFIIITTVCNV